MKPRLVSLVPTLLRGNAVGDAPASRNAGALQDEFPRWSVGTRKSGVAHIAFYIKEQP